MCFSFLCKNFERYFKMPMSQLKNSIPSQCRICTFISIHLLEKIIISYFNQFLVIWQQSCRSCSAPELLTMLWSTARHATTQEQHPSVTGWIYHIILYLFIYIYVYIYQVFRYNGSIQKEAWIFLIFTPQISLVSYRMDGQPSDSTAECWKTYTDISDKLPRTPQLHSTIRMGIIRKWLA